MKKTCLLLPLSLLATACTPKAIIQNNYVLEKFAGSEIPVCVNHPMVLIEKKKPCTETHSCEKDMCGFPVRDSGIYEKSDDICDSLEPEVVSYTYCLLTAPKPVHLVVKTEKNMTICYDRNNNIQLPIKYCLPDTKVNVDVSTYTHVQQSMKLNQTLNQYQINRPQQNNFFWF